MAALGYVARTGAAFGGGRERVEGIRLAATDDDGDVGDGPTVRGRAIALLLVASGRPVGPHELDGEGVAVLSARG